MPLNRDLRDLLSQPNHGSPPDQDNEVTVQIMTAWEQARAEREGEHVRSSNAPFWASDGAGCARRTGYSYLSRMLPDAPGPSDPPTIADQWRFNLGNVVHDALQEVAEPLGYENEIRAVLKDAEGNDLVSSRGDMYRAEDGTLIEIKSMNGFGFKMAATTFKGAPEGPRWNAVVQLALTAKALVEDGKPVTRGVLVIASLENISPKMAESFAGAEVGKFAAQWTYDIETLIDLADDTIAWLTRIKNVLDAGKMPPRVVNSPQMPRQAVIVNPSNGLWEVRNTDGEVIDSGSTWMCRYCDWQTRCASEA